MTQFRVAIRGSGRFSRLFTVTPTDPHAAVATISICADATRPWVRDRRDHCDPLLICGPRRREIKSKAQIGPALPSFDFFREP
jgi:hypothetical protein